MRFMSAPPNYTCKIQQHPQELAEFIAFLKRKPIASFLEIGSKFGGMLWSVANTMPPRSKIVSVDLPNGPWGRSESLGCLQDCVAELKRRGHDAHLFVGDSTTSWCVARVQELAPYDLIFIDANHTEPYVRQDFKNFGRLAKTVCFHDIAWNNPTPPGRMPIEVPKVWKELKMQYKDEATFSEIKCDQGHNGIGIMEWS